MNPKSKIVVFGANGLVGSSLIRRLKVMGYDNVTPITRKDADLTCQDDVEVMMGNVQPEYIFDAAAKVGGIHANNVMPAEFIYNNLAIQTNIIEACRKYDVKKLCFLGSVCFPMGTMIITRRGITDIVDVKIGDYVLTHQHKFQKVYKTTTNVFNKKLIVIGFKGWNKLSCTPEHLIYTKRGFVAAKDITKEDLILIPLADELKMVDNMSQRKITTDLAELSGYFVAEGCLRQNASGKRGSYHNIFFYPGHDEVFKDDICSKISTVFGINPHSYKKRTSWQICVNGEDMCNFFRSFYNDDLIHKAHTKFIPQFMMNSSNEIISKFLKGYWRGDGHWKMRTDRKNNQYFCTASSTSKELIYQLQQLLLKLRIFSTIYYKKKSPTCVIENRIVNQRSQWEVKIVGLDAIKFIIEILNENIDEFHPSYKPRINHTFNGDFLEIKVKNIHHIDTEEMVYDLSVENDHSYTANGIAVHNCIYPKYAEVPVKEESLLTGELEPTNQAYAIAKIAGIKMCQAYRKQYGCDFISVMPCNLYGENDNFHPTYSHVIPALIRRFVEATEKDAPTVTVWGTGNARREFLYVDDMADACIFLMEKYSDERIINIGYGTDYTIKDIVGNIAEIIGYKGEIIWDTTKPDGTPKRILDTSRLFDMDWRPQIPLKEGLTKTINWYKLHKDETK